MSGKSGGVVPAAHNTAAAAIVDGAKLKKSTTVKQINKTINFSLIKKEN